MRRNHFVYVIVAAALIAVLGSSLEFRRLDEKRAEERASRFSPAEYARDFWDNRLQTALTNLAATDALVRLFNTDMTAAVRLGRTLGQSRVHAYLLQGEGRITAVEKDGLLLSVATDDPAPEVFLCTGSYVSGNAIRDASGLVDVSTFFRHDEVQPHQRRDQPDCRTGSHCTVSRGDTEGGDERELHRCV